MRCRTCCLLCRSKTNAIPVEDVGQKHSSRPAADDSYLSSHLLFTSEIRSVLYERGTCFERGQIPLSVAVQPIDDVNRINGYMAAYF